MKVSLFLNLKEKNHTLLFFLPYSFSSFLLQNSIKQEPKTWVKVEDDSGVIWNQEIHHPISFPSFRFQDNEDLFPRVTAQGRTWPAMSSHPLHSLSSFTGASTTQIPSFILSLSLSLVSVDYHPQTLLSGLLGFNRIQPKRARSHLCFAPLPFLSLFRLSRAPSIFFFSGHY